MNRTNRRALVLLLVLYLVAPVQSLATVKFAERTGITGVGVTSISGSTHKISGSNTYVACGVVGDTGTLKSATYGSVPMTRKSSARIGRKWVEVWELAAPERKGGVPTFTASQIVYLIIANCLYFTGVNQRSPSGPAGTPRTGRNGRLRARVTVPTNGAGVSFGFNADATACGSQKSDQTPLFDFCDDDKRINVFGSITTAAGVVSMTWTLSGRHDSGLVAFPLNPAVPNTVGGPAVIKMTGDFK